MYKPLHLISLMLSAVISASYSASVVPSGNSNADCHDLPDIFVSRVSIPNAVSSEPVDDATLQSHTAGESADTSDTRSISIMLHVTDTYTPYLIFHCNIEHGGNYWGITSISSVELSCDDAAGREKQFNGNISAWLRSPYEIEYAIVGDFYSGAKQVRPPYIAGEYAIDEMIDFNGTVTNTNSSIAHYFYDHQNAVLQS